MRVLKDGADPMRPLGELRIWLIAARFALRCATAPCAGPTVCGGVSPRRVQGGYGRQVVHLDPGACSASSLNRRARCTAAVEDEDDLRRAARIRRSRKRIRAEPDRTVDDHPAQLALLACRDQAQAGQLVADPNSGSGHAGVDAAAHVVRRNRSQRPEDDARACCPVTMDG